jgi:hypothetical protein
MPKSLRKLVRYARRAGHILLNQGPGFLLQVVERHFKEVPSPVRPPARLLALSEPFEPLCFPECPTPIASVVIPIQEELRVIHHCLAALLAQRCSHPFEVIVVETRPTEDRAVPQRLWKNVQYVTSRELLGLRGSRNRGAEAASGEYLVFLCGHTQVQAGWLDALIDTFELRKVRASWVAGLCPRAGGNRRRAALCCATEESARMVSWTTLRGPNTATCGPWKFALGDRWPSGALCSSS